MSVLSRSLPAPRRRRRQAPQFRLESLELRQLLAGSPLTASTVSLVEVEPNDTVDVAQNVGDLSESPSVQVLGAIGNGPAGAADVDWYEFTLDRPARVVMAASPQAESPNFHPVLSLYNNDPYDFQDPYNPLGYRQLAQDDSSAHHCPATIEEPLCAGTYDVAVSGAGNLYYCSLLAASGFPGQTGDYNLTLTSTDLPIQPGDGPSVLTTEPAPGTVLDSSPLVIRVDLSGPLDPSTINPGQTVQLLCSPSGSSAQNGQNVPLSAVNFSPAINELQLFPARALPPGRYEVLLVGQSGDGSVGLADPTANPLGADSAHPGGQDFSYTFQVDGIDGNTGPAAAADDTPATSHDLGDISSQGLIQVAGAIGDDPFYDSSNPDPLFNPGNQVDLYHFQVDGPGPFALVAEVFAGRIGSPLDPGVSLFRLAPDGRTLDFVAGDNNTYNPVQATDGSTPLALDAALTAGLTQGDYYIAVSSGWNTPSPLETQPVDTPGLFDPTVSHSGSIGFSTGLYVLNLMVQPVPKAPRVIASSPAPGDVLSQSPTQLTIQFSEPVNLNQLAFAAYNQVTAEDPLPAVFIEGSSGVIYYPRLESYDAETNTASFLMLVRLPSGSYSLHVSGAGGLTDLAGIPLVGNEPGGDQVIQFQVNTADPGRSFDASSGFEMTLPANLTSPDDLGVLFPHELQAGITLARNPGGNEATSSFGGGDEFQFQVLQSQTYCFFLTGSDLPAGIQLSLTDDAGNPIPCGSIQDGQVLLADLAPGKYRIEVSGWDPSLGSAVAYQLHFGLQCAADNPPPLVSGPAPALVLNYADSNPAPSPGGSGATPDGPMPLSTTVELAPMSAGGSVPPVGEQPAARSAGGGGATMPAGGISGLGAGHVDLAALGMGPMGGVGEVVHDEASAPPIQLAISAPTTSAQGLLALFVLTRTGTLSLPSASAPGVKPEDETPAQPAANPSTLALIEPSETLGPVLALPQPAEEFSLATLLGNEAGTLNGAQDQRRKPDSSPDESRSDAARLEDATTENSPAGAKIITWLSKEEDAGMVPDWVGWLAAAGILARVSHRASRWRWSQPRLRSGLRSWFGGNPTGWSSW